MASSCIVLHVCVLSALRHSYSGLSCFLMISLGRFSMEARDSFCFPKNTKIRTLLLLEKSSDFVVVVHLQGLEPWTHWLRETNVQQSSIFRITQICYFYRFIVNLCFASAAFFAPVVLSCIRYPAVPVCKKCAKMCRAKISPLKQVSDFYAKPEKRPGSNPKWQLQSCLFRLSIKCTSTTTIHGRDLDNCDLL